MWDASPFGNRLMHSESPLEWLVLDASAVQITNVHNNPVTPPLRHHRRGRSEPSADRAHWNARRSGHHLIPYGRAEYY